MIVDAAIPLIMEHGNAVTTKQIAEAAGVAEGTIFRAFGDKESIIRAAVEKFLDVEPLRAAVRSIDPELSLEQKINDILFHLRARMTGMIGIMQALGMEGKPPVRGDAFGFHELVASVLEPHRAELTVDTRHVAQFIRLVALGSVLPSLNNEELLDTATLAALVTTGIAGRTAER